MRKINFLFAFLLSMMGATQAWAFSITGPEILNSSDWSKESGRWNEWSGGIYDYAGGNYLSDTEIISPLLTHTSSNGVKITINGNNNGGSTSVLKVYYSTDKNNWYLAKDLSSDMNATTGSAVDMVADFPVEGNYYVKLVCNKVFIISFTAEDIVISPKTVYLAVNDSWKTDNARFALYTKNEITNVETWVDFQAVEREYDIYSASVPVGTTLIIPCRMNPATTENNWDNKWNQTQNITTITDNALYSISGWSYCTTGTYTPSTYTMTAVSEIAFGNMLGAATKTFTLTNSGTGILKNIIFATGEGVTIDNVPTELAAGANATISITLNAEGAYNDAMTISADYADDVTIIITGTNVVEEGKFYVDFLNSDIPKSWDNYTTEEQFEMNGSGGDRNAYSTAALTLLTTSRLIVNEGDKFYFTAKRENSTTYYGDNLSVYYQTTEGTWESSTLISLSASDMSNSEYQVYTLENLPVGDIWLGFNGKYVHIQQMYGLTEPTKTVSLKPTNVWDLADANERYAVYMWKGDGAEKIEDWADFTAVEGVEGCYEATFNDAYTSIILARMNGAAEVNSWNNVWNQTEDVTGENFYDGAIYTITSIDGGNDGKSTYTLGGSTLALSENDEESKVVAGTYDEVTVEFTMGAGKFAAICLPFATTTTALGEGVKAWAFTGYTDGNIDLSTTNELTAATPYIIYAANGINGLTFQNVNIESAEAGYVVDGDAIFQGSYVKMAAGTMMGKYGVTPAGKIQKAGLGASMKAFRAYFDGISQGAKLVCDGEIIGEATGIDTIEDAAQAGELYDLQGRRVMNAQKGLYIQNGKKFVVK